APSGRPRWPDFAFATASIPNPRASRAANSRAGISRLISENLQNAKNKRLARNLARLTRTRARAAIGAFCAVFVEQSDPQCGRALPNPLLPIGPPQPPAPMSE